MSSQQGVVSSTEDSKWPFCSVIIPCRNELRFISQCLDSILANDYPKNRLEVLIADGMSEDGTRVVLEKYVRQHPFIRVLNNPKRSTPAALNIGLKNATGEIIVRLDAHSWVEKDYISRCVKALDQFGADNAGGIMKTLADREGFWSRAIVVGLSHRFGVGNSFFRIHTREPRWVDTVFGGCYKKAVFESVGLFNESLVRGQDMEFNLRLKRAGCRTILVPDIVSYYYARTDLKSFARYNWINGVWAILPFIYSDGMPVSWRHLVPLAFVAGLLGSAIVALVWSGGGWALRGLVGVYSVVNIVASLHIAIGEKRLRYLFLMPFVFASFHLSYGLGSFWGLLKVVWHHTSGFVSKGVWKSKEHKETSG